MNETTAPALYHRALEALDRAFSGDGAPAPFADLRAEARGTFESLGLPTTKDEAWKYTDLRPALKADYQFADPDRQPGDVDGFAIPGLDAARVVLVNGHYRAELSDLSGLPDGVVVGGLREAARDSGATLADYFGTVADVSADAFAALNASFDLDGLYLHVPRNVAVERVVHVVHVIAADEPTFAQTRHLVVVGENAQVKVVETYHTVGEGTAETFRNDLTEVVAGPAAHVEHVRVQDEGDAANGVSLVHAHQERDSTVSTLTFTFASGTVRNNTTMVPDGEGCQSTLGGLYICRGEQHVDTHTLVDHVAPGCQSNELFKGIVYEKSTGVFNGKVFVHRAAQQTNAYQQSQGVVLSPDAKHYSKPELEIYADDVKCSHGSTTGAVEPEHIFYLRSRGVSEADARAMLLYAFAHDVVEMVSIEPLRDWLDEKITERLK
jgi:Fe-S cluster assembly protein SufD